MYNKKRKHFLTIKKIIFDKTEYHLCISPGKNYTIKDEYMEAISYIMLNPRRIKMACSIASHMK